MNIRRAAQAALETVLTLILLGLLLIGDAVGGLWPDEENEGK